MRTWFCASSIDAMVRPLPPDNQISATHAEVRHAREMKKPVYVFGRDRTLLDFDQLRGNSDAKTKWIEEEGAKRTKWMSFVDELRDLRAQTDGHSNWFDQFSTSPDLKNMVLKRLGDFQRRTSVAGPCPGARGLTCPGPPRQRQWQKP